MTGFANDLDVKVDVEALVGEMEDPGCEHTEHGERTNFHEGPAEFYVMAVHVCAGSRRTEGEVYPVCGKFVRVMQSLRSVRCAHCQERFTPPLQAFIRVVGKVKP